MKKPLFPKFSMFIITFIEIYLYNTHLNTNIKLYINIFEIIRNRGYDFEIMVYILV